MKTNVHPTWYQNCIVTCACGTTFTVGATMPTITIDVCSACHPFYTGQMKYLDSAGRIDAFRSKQSHAKAGTISKADRRKAKREQKLTEELARPDTLEALRSTKLH